jgi:hypothetical protein
MGETHNDYAPKRDVASREGKKELHFSKKEAKTFLILVP